MDTTISTRYAQAIEAKFKALNESRGRETTDTYTVMSGRKFDRIVEQHNSQHWNQRMVHAFVERATGKLIKAAGWDAPQKDKSGLAYRYDLSTPEGFAEALEAADWAGSYLYKR